MKETTFRILFIRAILCISLIVGFTNSNHSQDYDRDSWQKPEKVMDVLGVKPGMVIGEAGAGRGYFTFKLAKRVGDTGKIYANDISLRALNYIQGRCRREGIDNIEIILGEVDDPLFPKGQMDMVIMVYVFHHLEKPVEFLKNIKPSLKPGAPLVILEQDPEKSDEAIGHFLKKEVILDKVEESGYELVRIETFLQKDNIYIYRSVDVQSSEWLNSGGYSYETKISDFFRDSRVRFGLYSSRCGTSRIQSYRYFRSGFDKDPEEFTKNR